MNKQASIAIPQRAAQGGFTLIELIVVIVILGILAATALPKFSDLSGDARAASVNAAGGALRSAMSIAHGQSLINGDAAKDSSNVTLEGTTIAMVYGYPAATSAAVRAVAGLNTEDYAIATANGATVPTLTGSQIAIQPVKNPKATCAVVYTPATSTAAATVTITTTNCL